MGVSDGSQLGGQQQWTISPLILPNSRHSCRVLCEESNKRIAAVWCHFSPEGFPLVLES